VRRDVTSLVDPHLSHFDASFGLRCEQRGCGLSTPMVQDADLSGLVASLLTVVPGYKAVSTADLLVNAPFDG
jgi:hypothetical protein